MSEAHQNWEPEWRGARQSSFNVGFFLVSEDLLSHHETHLGTWRNPRNTPVVGDKVLPFPNGPYEVVERRWFNVSTLHIYVKRVEK